MPIPVDLRVNGRAVHLDVEAETLLADALRINLGLTGTRIGCDTSQCGSCTVHVDGRAVKSCTLLAVQAGGSEITTIEGLGSPSALHPMQAAFREHHALQCGFCTAGMIMAAVDLLASNPNPTEAEVRAGLVGNICRCTGYHNIVAAVLACARPLPAAPVRETAHA